MTNSQVEQDNVELVNIDVEVGIIVQSLIFRRRMTLQEVGDAIGCAKSSVSRKLRGHTAFSFAELYKLGRALEVDPADLLPRLDSNQQPCGYPSVQVSDAEMDHWAGLFDDYAGAGAWALWCSGEGGPYDGRDLSSAGWASLLGLVDRRGA